MKMNCEALDKITSSREAVKMVDVQALRQKFRELYGRTPRLFRAPGRVNLIGEHTDYNDGFVLPMAINHSTFVAGAARTDNRVRVHSLDFNEQYEFDLADSTRVSQAHWLDYVEGVARSLKEGGTRLTGADLLIQSEVPIGGGLSSSAALEISTGFALLRLSGAQLDLVKLAKAGQRAEHDYVGAKVGIMDQMAAVFGRKGFAIFLDCRTLETSLIPLNTEKAAVVVCDSRIKHALASSEYNKRRAECEEGVAILKTYLPHITALRDVSVEEFQQLEKNLPEPVVRRCRHVVTENERTLKAVQALGEDDLKMFGQLMLASHQSLRDDYEVSCKELDILTEIASEIPGVLGARMTGGGFGGCTVNVVERSAVERFCDTVSQKYQEATQLITTIYVIDSGNGVEEVQS
jgi:galactokinase